MAFSRMIRTAFHTILKMGLANVEAQSHGAAMRFSTFYAKVTKFLPMIHISVGGYLHVRISLCFIHLRLSVAFDVKSGMMDDRKRNKF